jgi:hypothetical protein
VYCITVECVDKRLILVLNSLNWYCVGVITRSGLRLAMGFTVGGSNPGGDEIFHTRPDRPRGPPSPLNNGYWFSFPGVKWPGHGVDHSPPSSAEVKERVELYLYCLWAFVACYRVNCTCITFQ